MPMPTRGRIDAAPHAADLLATLGVGPAEALDPDLAGRVQHPLQLDVEGARPAQVKSGPF